MIQYVSYYMKKRNTFYLVTMCEAQKKKQKQSIQNRQNKGKPKTKVKTTLLFCFDNNKSTVTQLLW